MANRDILAIGASAGGVEAVRFLAARLPRDLPASVLFTIHLSAQFPSTLDDIVTQSGPLPARFAADGERVERCRIYIAPPARHLILDGDRLRLGLGPRENHARPAIDPMFRSTAVCCGARAIGVVLTGTLGDGASGLKALKDCGGVTVVQDPDDAAYPEMPSTALSLSTPDHVVTLAEMPALLKDLVEQPMGQPNTPPERIRYEVDIARGGRSSMEGLEKFGRRSVLACPDCHGVMWEIDEGGLTRFRCHIGHAFAAELLGVALEEDLARAMGSAVRALEERVALAEKLHRQADEAGRSQLADSWARRARDLAQEAEVIRTSLRRLEEISIRAARQR